MSTTLQRGGRMETITRGTGENGHDIELGQGIMLREFASSRLGAVGFSTGMCTFAPGAYLDYHFHPCGEAITILRGEVQVLVEGRRYDLGPFDCTYLPAGVAHAVHSLTGGSDALIHTAFGSAIVERTFVENRFQVDDPRNVLPAAAHPEALRRFSEAEEYELSPNTLFRDLSGALLGCREMCGGYGCFAPGASLPCHIHDYDESITIVEGRATCFVEGRRYTLSDYATALVPRGCRHRFVNESDVPMAMLWVYAGERPERRIVDEHFCSDCRGES